MNPPPAPANPWLGRAFAFAVVAFVWWRISENTADNDLWGHVLYGQRMLNLGHLEHTDVLSWTAAGRPWINHEVLAELALGLVHRLAGGTGLWLLMVGLAGATLGWAWCAGAGRARGQRLAALVLLALSTNFIALGCSARPQLFTYLFFVVLLVALRGLSAGKAAWGFVPPALLVVWVNTHGGFLAGWLVVALALGVEFATSFAPAMARRLHSEPPGLRRLTLANVALASTAALAVNPWSWNLVLWTLGTLRLPRPHILEWQPMPFTAATVPFYFVLGLGLLAWSLSRLPRRLWEPVVWFLFAILAVRHQRHAPLFGLASLILLPAHLQDLLGRFAAHADNLRTALQRPVIATFAVLALLSAGATCLWASVTAPRAKPFRMEVPRSLFPVAAIDFIRAHHLTGNTITFFDWGQQVLWELPDNPVSFDGRLDTVYPVEIMDAHWRLYAGEEPGLVLDLNNADVALLPTGSGAIAILRDWSWTEVYRDPLATVLVRLAYKLPPPVGLQRAGAGAVAGRAPFPETPPVLATGRPR